MMVITMITVMTLMTLHMILAERNALAQKEQECITYRSRSVCAKTWQKGNRSMTSENLLSFCVINVIIVITVITVIIVIKCMSQLQQREFKEQTLTGKTTLHRKNKKMLLYKGIAVRIIRRHGWCVLIPQVRRGATSWIAGIASGS